MTMLYPNLCTKEVTRCAIMGLLYSLYLTSKMVLWFYVTFFEMFLFGLQLVHLGLNALENSSLCLLLFGHLAHQNSVDQLCSPRLTEFLNHVFLSIEDLSCRTYGNIIFEDLKCSVFLS